MHTNNHAWHYLHVFRAQHKLLFPVLGRCFAVFSTGYEFSRLLFPTFATACIYPDLELLLCFPALGTSYVFPLFSLVTISLSHLSGTSFVFPAFVSGYVFTHLAIGVVTFPEF